LKLHEKKTLGLLVNINSMTSHFNVDANLKHGKEVGETNALMAQMS